MTVSAFHAHRPIVPDPDFEIGLAAHLRQTSTPAALAELYARFASGPSDFDRRMRRVIWRALARGFGHAVEIGLDVRFTHLETFEIGDGVSIGDQAILHGRINGNCTIGDRSWIGAQVFLDARALVIEAKVGLGPGTKVLGSTHTGAPAEAAIIETDLEIALVRIAAGADVGMAAVILPGVTIGPGAIIGAGAVVTQDVPARAVAAGVPARFVRWRDGSASAHAERDK